MKLANNSLTSARLSPRLANSPALFTPAPRRETLSVRPAPRDGFESTVSARNTRNVQSLFQRQFGALAGDKQRFHETMRGIFGGGYDTAKAEQYRQQALAGDFGWMPPVQWVDSQTLQGGHGAYDSRSGKVLLNRDLQGNPALAASTYVEEAGHHLDARLNTVDSQGDEGELFRRILGGEKLTGAQVADIRAENDKGTIQLDGQSVDVEFRRRNIFQRIGDAVGDAVDAVGDALGDAVDAVGDAAATVVGGVVGGSVDVLGAIGLTKKSDLRHDGQFVGVGGITFPPGTPLNQMPGITPSYNTNPETTVLYVNGILTDLEDQVQEMRNIAE
ncbi:MAG TPA: hypothetical protein VF794_06135, partial [Archangium sp.]|uniref:hypothetical protein n=1 Tax=Archangium sp. TaxID=1872627 RepID=UPI002ED81963